MTVSRQDKPSIFSKKAKEKVGISKQIADFLEDFWRTIQGAVSKDTAMTFGVLLNGVAGFFISIADSYLGAKDTYHGYHGDYKSHRRARTALGMIMFFTGVSGILLSLELIKGLAGAPLFAYPIPVLSVIVSGVLTINSGLGLIRQVFSLLEAKRKEKSAQLNLDLSNQNDPEYENKKQALANARDHRFKTERDVAFKTIEVAATIALLVGSILGTAAIIGAASVASFGVVPTVICVAALSVMFFSKILQATDKGHDYAFTKKIRSWFSKPKLDDDDPKKDDGPDNNNDNKKGYETCLAPGPAGTDAKIIHDLNKNNDAGTEVKHVEDPKIIVEPPKPQPTIPPVVPPIAVDLKNSNLFFNQNGKGTSVDITSDLVKGCEVKQSPPSAAAA